MAHPQAFSLRVNANPLAGGSTNGPAKPVPWCLLEGHVPVSGCSDL